MSIFANYRRWRMYRNTVNELSHLSDEQLRDIGVYRGSIEKVARRSL
ncbi:DUF1127 domain-containing protein [Notoacmeibacter ruber]|uniref:DUF1127 domain-containing protein n=1 Tax=Notoacmeibacter ruber TaxID=2670375 RepID=A0A3L7JLR2_9HYPH|nr:DUF1127 domain-containing protein [Notoacmeibacter ruber]RLQ89462.1 DUF1127 domain-containing protein [Notoacmeibacter ruber]